MDFTIRPYTPADRDTLAQLFQDPAAARQWEPLAVPDGPERAFSDEYVRPESARLAFVGAEPVGFGYAVLLPGATPWCMLRGAVREPYRRRGIGRALHAELTRFVAGQSIVPGVRERAIGAVEPFDISEPFITSLGYCPDRTFWYMARPRGAAPPVPAWPAGVSVREFDGSDAMVRGWTDAYNDSFSGHYRFVSAPIEHTQHMVTSPTWASHALLLAYQGRQVAGFCHCEHNAMRGEVATLGTVHTARGLGLGRALLRWGVAWLETHTQVPVTLLVDGDNESALTLYKAEGFEVTRRRRVWANREPFA